jgi:hypothetical protein
MFPLSSGSLGTPDSAGPLPAALSSEATGAHGVTVIRGVPTRRRPCVSATRNKQHTRRTGHRPTGIGADTRERTQPPVGLALRLSPSAVSILSFPMTPPLHCPVLIFLPHTSRTL